MGIIILDRSRLAAALAILALLCIGCSDDDDSSPTGSTGSWNWRTLDSGMDDWVYDLEVYDGNIIVGGNFGQAGGVAARRIAAWDGSNWDSLGSGMVGYVYALAVYNGQLIAGGFFSSAGGVTLSNIAAWDGSTWSPLGTGVSGSVMALTVWNGKLIAGGSFFTAGGIGARHIAAWDGASWDSLGSGCSDDVYTLAEYSGRLVAGGAFDSAGGVQVNEIAAWDGSQWAPLGGGVDHDTYPEWVNALVEWNGRLVAGGQFTTAGSADVFAIAAWNDTAWSAMEGEFAVRGPVIDMTVFNDRLIVACTKMIIGGDNAGRIGGCDGASWYGLGGGFNDNVWALMAHDSRLYAGGPFTEAGGGTANYIAVWRFEQ